MKDEILTGTQFAHSEMVPELGLHVITPDMEVWNQPFDTLSDEFRSAFWHSSMPYWAIFWPGGQILSRHIIDFPNIVRNKRVVDLGAGSGALSLACIVSGCKNVVANDIDEMSLGATLLNAEKNNLMNPNKLHISNKNFLEGNLEENANELANQCDVLLVGDMYFDEQIGDKISVLAFKYASFGNNTSDGRQKLVLIGDPGRWYLKDKKKKHLNSLRCIAKYELTEEIKTHNYGLTQGLIYDLIV